MKKITFPLHSIISLSVVFVLSLLGFVADRIVGKGIYLYTGSSAFTIDDLRIFVIFVAITLLISAIVVFFIQKFKKEMVEHYYYHSTCTDFNVVFASCDDRHRGVHATCIC